MPFKRYVEIGRVALVNYGKDYGNWLSLLMSSTKTGPLEDLAVRHWCVGGYLEMVCEIDTLPVIISVEEVGFSFNGGKDSTASFLHLLRGGYLLQKAGKNMSTGASGDAEITFPMRTIYFESPSDFHGINSVTYDTALANLQFANGHNSS